MCAKRSAYEEDLTKRVPRDPRLRPEMKLHDCANFNQELLEQIRRIYTPKIPIEGRVKRPFRKTDKNSGDIERYDEARGAAIKGHLVLSQPTVYTTSGNKSDTTKGEKKISLTQAQLSEIERRRYLHSTSRDICFIEDMIENLNVLKVVYPESRVDGVIGGLRTLIRSKTRGLQKETQPGDKEGSCTEDAVDDLQRRINQLSESLQTVYIDDLQEERIRKYRFAFRDRLLATTITQKTKKTPSDQQCETLASSILKKRKRNEEKVTSEVITSLPPSNHELTPELLPPCEIIISDFPHKQEILDSDDEWNVVGNFSQNNVLNADIICNPSEVKANSSQSSKSTISQKKSAARIKRADEPLRKHEAVGMSPYIYSCYFAQKQIAHETQRLCRQRKKSVPNCAVSLVKAENATQHGIEHVLQKPCTINDTIDVESRTNKAYVIHEQITKTAGAHYNKNNKTVGDISENINTTNNGGINLKDFKLNPIVSTKYHNFAQNSNLKYHDASPASVKYDEVAPRVSQTDTFKTTANTSMHLSNCTLSHKLIENNRARLYSTSSTSTVSSSQNKSKPKKTVRIVVEPQLFS